MARLFLGVILCIAFTPLWCFAISSFYEKDSFVTPETRAEIAKVLQVTPEQRVELNRSVRICDELTFGLLGLLLGGVLAACCGRASSTIDALRAAGIGALLGALTGATAGYLGHAFQSYVHTSDNATVHTVMRLLSMFLPFAVAVGLAVALSGNLKRDAMDSIVGAVLGMLIAVTVFGLLSDANPSTRESETDILPRHLVNQAMLMGILGVTMCVLISSQTLRKKPSMKVEETAVEA